MTFTNDDLKRLNNKEGFRQWGITWPEFSSLLARLEASERANQWAEELESHPAFCIGTRSCENLPRGIMPRMESLRNGLADWRKIVREEIMDSKRVEEIAKWAFNLHKCGDGSLPLERIKKIKEAFLAYGEECYRNGFKFGTNMEVELAKELKEEGYKKGARAMREKAASMIENHYWDSLAGSNHGHFLVNAIRALEI